MVKINWFISFKSINVAINSSVKVGIMEMFTLVQYPDLIKTFYWHYPKWDLAISPQNLKIINDLSSIVDYRHYFDLFRTRVGNNHYGYIYILSPFCGSIFDWKSFRVWLFFFENIVKIDEISRKKKIRLLVHSLKGMAFQKACRFIHGTNEYDNLELIDNKPYEAIVEMLSEKFL